MLETLLWAGIPAALLGFAGLVMPVKRHARTVAGPWRAIRRFVLAVVAATALAAVVAVALRLLRVSGHDRAIGIAGVVFASLAWLPVTRRWTARAHLCWASSIFVVIVYLTIALEWTFASRSGTASTVGRMLLWLFELFAAVLSCAYLWEICEALGTEHWRRRVTPEVSLATKDSDLPMISLHVPAHNEPPDMVIDTLRSLVRIDYPRYEVILIDDNTDDEALWRPVQDWCAGHGVKFAHLENWPGYKSGALNYALRHLTDPRAELIGVVDSDYQIKPGFLRSCAPAFADPWIGFVQTPQDYRDWTQARFYRRLYYSYKYFFAISQPSRNEHDGAIFAGTMGLIRRVALDELGGWDEWCITEDAELSLRLLRAGWSGLHLDQSWGHGIMPLTFEALKGQRYRWCFGGIQILRMHWRSLMPGRTSKRNHLSTAQRWAYLVGGIQWYGDLLGLVFFGFLLAGAARPDHRRRRDAPQAHPVPAHDRAGAFRARAGAGGGAAPPRYRRLLARGHRRVLHLAVHLPRGGAGLRARPVRAEGGLPAHPEDERARKVVAGAEGELDRVRAGPAWRGRHRRSAEQGHHPAGRAAACRAAPVPDARHGCGALQQLGRAARFTAALAARAAAHRVPP